MIKTIADEIDQVSMERPHVVILGAGASRAAFPHGERTGKRLPVMADFFDVVPIGPVLVDSGIEYAGRNFEDIYAGIASDPGASGVRARLEKIVFDYFSSLELPESPTLYDHLVLSLRPKDVIATFNWDPFLIQAIRRNARIAKSPRLVFLHGNVLQGACVVCRVFGLRGAQCSQCQAVFDDVPLLYPIDEKNYDQNRAIQAAWEEIRAALKTAFMVTIFGYGAPQSDRGAIALLQEAWGSPKEREFEQFEIIDLRDRAVLAENWKAFIHTHHYEVHQSFYDSWIAKHPRRSGEAYWNQYMEAAFIEANPIPKSLGFPDLWLWCQPLLNAEAKA